MTLITYAWKLASVRLRKKVGKKEIRKELSEI